MQLEHHSGFGDLEFGAIVLFDQLGMQETSDGPFHTIKTSEP